MMAAQVEEKGNGIEVCLRRLCSSSRAKNLSPKERSESARKAAKARWEKRNTSD
jgi:hypothetical protein